MEDSRRSSSFRYCYANDSKINLLDGQLTIIFGIHEDPADSTNSLEETGVIMTRMAATILADKLRQALEEPEKEPGFSEIENSISLAIDAKLASDAVVL